MTQGERNYLWRKGYEAEVEHSIQYYNWLNRQQPVRTRQMTDEEREEYFGEKPESVHRLKVKKVENERFLTVLIDDINKVKRFVNIALSLPFYVDIVSDRYRIDSKSLMGVLSLDIAKPVQIWFNADNEDRVKFAFQEFLV